MKACYFHSQLYLRLVGNVSFLQHRDPIVVEIIEKATEAANEIYDAYLHNNKL